MQYPDILTAIRDRFYHVLGFKEVPKVNTWNFACTGLRCLEA